jgi:PAS domain S-box-containing protein
VAQIETATGRFVRINRRYGEIVGYSEAEMKNLTFQEITHPQDLPADLENMQRLRHGEVREFTMEKRYFDKNGRIVWVTLTVSPMWAPGDAPDFHIAVVQDISERKGFEERVRGLSRQLLHSQEEERRRISRELHDGIGQNLSAIKVGLDSQVVNSLEGGPEVREKALALSRLLGETIEGVRDMAHALRPTALEKLGLVQALIQFCEDFEDKNRIAVDLVSAGIDDRALDYDTRIALYRLVQEGLINIKKHAEASRATIRLVSSFPNLILRIEDNGRGFDVEKRKEAAGREKRLGLSSMEERVSLLGGLMKIDSQSGQGTRITIEIPQSNPWPGGGHGP